MYIFCAIKTTKTEKEKCFHAFWEFGIGEHVLLRLSLRDAPLIFFSSIVYNSDMNMTVKALKFGS